MGLHGNMLHTIQSVLKCNFQQILDGELVSNEIEQKSGGAQGDKLSTLLFSLYIADLYFELKCKAPQVEVPDGKSICPDPDERTTGVSCVQIYMVWKQGKTHESLDMNARIVW